MNDEVKILVPAPPPPVRPTAPRPSAVSLVRPPTLAEMKLKAQQSPRVPTPPSDKPEVEWEHDGEGWQRVIPMPDFKPKKRRRSAFERLQSVVRDEYVAWDDLSKRSGVPVKKIESFVCYRSVPKQEALDALSKALGLPSVKRPKPAGEPKDRK